MITLSTLGTDKLQNHKTDRYNRLTSKKILTVKKIIPTKSSGGFNYLKKKLFH